MSDFVNSNIKGCDHYRRNCKLISPCCNMKYWCRLCHNEKENHEIVRKNITKIECNECHTEQSVSQFCIRCKVCFGKYFCGICRLFDYQDKQQYHCDGCGLCRVGGKDNYFHCDNCQMCLPLLSSAESHKCIENISKRDCPVCLEDLHTSRITSHVPPCGHLLHTTCFNDLIKTNFYSCPTCGRSLANMDSVWKKLDDKIIKSPMPPGFNNVICIIQCKDCQRESTIQFHSLGLKCGECGSYNTTKIRQRIVPT